MAQGKILGTPNPNPKHVGISQAEKDALASFINIVEERITEIAQTVVGLMQFVDYLGSRIVRLEEETGVGAPPEEPEEGAEETAPVGEDVSEAQIIELADRLDTMEEERTPDLEGA